MATFYHYGVDGTVITSSLDPAASAFASGPWDPGLAYEEQGDFVGAFLARREKANFSYLAFVAPQDQAPPDTSYGLPYNQPVEHPSYPCVTSEPTGHDQYPYNCFDSSQYAENNRFHDSASDLGQTGWTSQSAARGGYPNPEEIRHLYTLRDLLPYLQPERKFNALEGPVLDIVEEDKGTVLAHQIPKKLLVLFLGRKVVNRFIRTLHPRDDVTTQDICLPRGRASEVALQILLGWMMRACQYHMMDTMEYIRVPHHLFSACSLAETMELFGLYKDALRVDKYIAKNHFSRPLFAKELACVWSLLGESNRYVYAVIKIVAERLRQHEKNGAKPVKGINDDMYALLKATPRLEARVRDSALNEKYRPVFGTQWTKNLEDNTEDQRRNSVLNIEASGQGSPGKTYPNSQETGLLVKKPQPAGPTKAVRKFGTLRIVPEATKATSKRDPAVTESSEKNQKW